MRSLWIIITALLLTSCSQAKPTYQYFLLHPHALNVQYERCIALPMVVVENDSLCMTVFFAASKFKMLLLEGANQTQQFGQKLLNAQTEYVGQQAALKQAEKEGDQTKLAVLKQKVAKLDFQIQSMMIVIRLLRPH